MKNKDVEDISRLLREENVPHLMFVRVRKGIAVSSIANGDDIYDFLQVLVEQNPVILDIMQSVIDSRKPKEEYNTADLLN